jgi:hypothetical protein
VVAVSGGNGLTLGSPQDITDNGMNVPYSVSSSPSSTGQYGITVTTTSGTSNTYNITVGDPTPVITGISPGSQGNPPDHRHGIRNRPAGDRGQRGRGPLWGCVRRQHRLRGFLQPHGRWDGPERERDGDADLRRVPGIQREQLRIGWRRKFEQ